MIAQQLDLWTEPQEIPGEISYSWADGDTSPAQLERLAAVMLKHSLDCVRIDGRSVFIRILSTRVADGKVWATYKEVPSPLGTKGPVEDEEDEEVA